MSHVGPTIKTVMDKSVSLLIDSRTMSTQSGPAGIGASHTFFDLLKDEEDGEPQWELGLHCLRERRPGYLQKVDHVQYH